MLRLLCEDRISSSMLCIIWTCLIASFNCKSMTEEKWKEAYLRFRMKKRKGNSCIQRILSKVVPWKVKEKWLLEYCLFLKTAPWFVSLRCFYIWWLPCKMFAVRASSALRGEKSANRKKWTIIKRDIFAAAALSVMLIAPIFPQNLFCYAFWFF